MWCICVYFITYIFITTCHRDLLIIWLQQRHWPHTTSCIVRREPAGDFDTAQVWHKHAPPRAANQNSRSIKKHYSPPRGDVSLPTPPSVNTKKREASEIPDTIIIVLHYFNIGVVTRGETSAVGVRWFLTGGWVHHELSVTDSCAGHSTTSRSNLSLTDSLWTQNLVGRFPRTSLVHSAARQHKATTVFLLFVSLFGCFWGEWENNIYIYYRTHDERKVEMFQEDSGGKRERDGYVTVKRASPCAVSVFPPLGGNFWEAPLSVRRCVEKEQVKPTEKSHCSHN